MRATSMMAGVSAIAVLIYAVCCSEETSGEPHYRYSRGVVVGNIKHLIRKMECTTDSNCKRWPKTSCGEDPVDHRKRCLCADQTHPINENCITQPQELGQPCERDVQCIQLAKCEVNLTVGDTKVCQCREEFYTEDDGTCSSAMQAVISTYLAFVVAVIFHSNY
ncbi:uncharacterized protein LOC126833436 [Adelges cooleyi]|uniref:uncharacterized protein LOC126833436 n=1 Tax=Adelges cooleyi TaxID=133065 RepID=UPI00218041D6|nr:uncharacterized protein LOC126833436 [Adelges cooleyi]